jgi:pimeloyl-ACP methyl ester carboxylesterase
MSIGTVARKFVEMCNQGRDFEVMRTLRRFAMRSAQFAAFVVATLALIGPASAQQAKTVVLVHGAFADGSSWDKVIPLLQAKGLNVVAVQNPLTSLADDVAATRRAIAEQNGPVILVGHSWGGTVITEAGNDDKVAALVYVAAFAPAEGQSSGELGKDYPPPPGSGKLKQDKSGFLTLTAEGVAKDFAQDLPAAQTKVMAVTQGPISAKAFGDKVTAAAWKKKPSWYIVAKNDHMIQPELEEAMAKNIKATTTTLPTSHVSMQSRPKDVAAVIIAAAEAVK